MMAERWRNFPSRSLCPVNPGLPMNVTEPIRVLIAEDDPLINQGLADQLRRLGFALAGQAYDGPQAIELAAMEKPGVILMDLQMIDPMTGREDPLAGLKAARVFQEHHNAAVILLTAHESPDLIRLASQTGVSAYLVKPAQDNDIARAIAIGRARYDDLLELHQMSVELQHHKEELQAELARVKALRGWLSTCAFCKRVRDEQDEWKQMEVYIQDHSEAMFTHGFCPECFHKHFPDIHLEDYPEVNLPTDAGGETFRRQEP